MQETCKHSYWDSLPLRQIALSNTLPSIEISVSYILKHMNLYVSGFVDVIECILIIVIINVNYYCYQ